MVGHGPQALAKGASGSSKRGEPFRPFFWIDDQGRVRDWPEAIARALHRPARSALGRPCWEVVSGGAGTARLCRQCPVARHAMHSAPIRPAPGHCAVLPLASPAREAIVWVPFSRMAAGPSASARLEGLAISGALTGRLESPGDTLDGLRRACGADDCELFLLDATRRELVLAYCEGADRDALLEQSRMSLGNGYPGTVAQLMRPLFTNCVPRDERFLRSAIRRSGLRSFLGVPLVRDDRPFGYIGLGWREASVPEAWAVRVVEDARALVTVALRGHEPPAASTGAGPLAPALDIRCFGTFDITLHGRRLPSTAFGRRKALELLKILILQDGAPIHADRLVEWLWPGVAPILGANRLHGVVNALRSALEQARHRRSSAYILHRDGHYQLDASIAQSIDLHRFTALVNAAHRARRRGATAEALRAWEQAIELYRGDLFAGDAGHDSFEPERARQRHAYLDAVREVTRAQLLSGQVDEAIRLLRAALVVEPAALDLQEVLITELARAGRIREARDQYAGCGLAARSHLDMGLPPRMRALEKLFN